MDIREATITETVRRIWEDSLPSIPFALDKSWSDTGLDSLKALEFVFRLERALGIRVGFDAMTADSTASDLIRLLASEMDKAAQSVDARPQIFLIPGMFGDEPRLGLFRRALNREVKFHTLELPGLEFPSKVHRKIGVTATKLIKDLIRLRPEGDIILCGYSFGGLVAQDMARQLEAKGRQVAFLAVLDGMLLPVTARDDMEVPVNKPDSLAAKMQGGWRFFLDRALFASLLRLNVWEAARRFLLAAAPRHDWSWTNTRGRWLLDRMRSWAVLTLAV